MNPFVKVFASLVKVLKTPLKLWSMQQKLVAVIASLGVVFAGLITTTAVLHSAEPEDTTPSTSQTEPSESTTAPTTTPTTAPPTTVPPTTEPAVKERIPVITDKVLELRELYEQNQDTYGWVQVPGTKIDEIVMLCRDNRPFYLYHNFQKGFSASGLVYVEKFCKMDPEDMVIQLLGHNMQSGRRFGELINFQNEHYWKQHPYIWLTTTEGARTYEIVTAGYDEVYEDDSGKFQFHYFVNPTEEEFEEGMAHFYENSCYDTGVEAKYGDSMLMLVTCAYHVDNGRFVVLAREVDYIDPKDAKPIS